MTTFLKWFSGGDRQYLPLTYCLHGDTLTAWLLMGLSALVFLTYLGTAYYWWRDEKTVSNGNAREALRKLKWIFILCAFCGYGITPLQSAWPAYRLKVIALIPLVYLSVSFLCRGCLKDVYGSMSQATKDHADLDIMRETLDTMPNMAWTADKDGSINWYNKQWYSFTGTTFEQMKGWGWQTVHDPRELPRIMEKWQACIATGTPFEDTFPLLGSNGRYRWFLTRVTPKKDANGNVLCWYGGNTDVEHMHRGQLHNQDLLRDLTERMNAKERRGECPREQ